jgi:hypothetical protein
MNFADAWPQGDHPLNCAQVRLKEVITGAQLARLARDWRALPL